MEKIERLSWLDIEYMIPCFQREYSWDIKEIEELITDIEYSENDYCIGIVIITKNKREKIVIDGQQRITTLYLLAIACGLVDSPNKIKLSFETDDIIGDSNVLKDLITNNKNKADYIIDKYNHILELIKEKKIFREKLNNIYYYEIDIDSNDTDLNHYFEVINSRGIQLRKSDIIKSKIMYKLIDKKNKERLNNLWSSFENMKKNNYKSFLAIKTKDDYKEKTIKEIIESGQYNNNVDNIIEEDLNSILDCEYFLLYAVRLYRELELGIHDDNKMFELKYLVNDYEKTLRNMTETEVINFLDYLIDTKNIYDNKIIKRANNTTDEEGKWSINCSNKKDIIRIQSCLRVSFTNRKLMRWIYDTLKYYKNKGVEEKYVFFMRNNIRNNYIIPFINEFDKKDYQTGFDTPHIVLNYLDYLLLIYQDELDIPYIKALDLKSFAFKYRNSIEHFLSRENIDKENNKDWINDFGNLALLAYGTNTKMQTAEPLNKADHFSRNLSDYSIKLQLMTKLTLEDKKCDYYTWRDKCKELRKELILLLKKDLEELDIEMLDKYLEIL